MLRTVTEDLDCALEVLLPEVIFSKEPNNTCWMEGLLMTEELYQYFEAKTGKTEFFLFSKCFLFAEFLCSLTLCRYPLLRRKILQSFDEKKLRDHLYDRYKQGKLIPFQRTKENVKMNTAKLIF